MGILMELLQEFNQEEANKINNDNCNNGSQCCKNKSSYKNNKLRKIDDIIEYIAVMYGIKK